jgi:uncharacterized protein YigE (DUF2233 family)
MMRLQLGFICVLTALALAGCRPNGPGAGAPNVASLGLPEASFAVFHPPLKRGAEEVEVTLVRLRAADFEMVVIDNGTHPNYPRYANLGAALPRHGCLAGINGGFFDPGTFEPNGLLVADGKTIKGLDRTNLPGGVVAMRAGQWLLTDQREFKMDGQVSQAVQAGPWLLRDRKAERGFSNAEAQAARSFIATDGQGMWLLGRTAPCTLPELAVFLTSPTVREILQIQDALNLDGGPSSGLCVNMSATSQIYLQEDVAVRDFLGLRPRVREKAAN